jgi:hypothetical protein
LETLYQALIHARMLGISGRTNGLSAGDAVRLDDLMDAIHNIPHFITRWEMVDEQLLRDCLAAYDEKWAAVTSLRLLPVYEQKIASRHGAG